MQKVSDYAIKFGRTPEMGLEPQKSFPFIYTFVNYSDCQWRPSSDPVITDPDTFLNNAYVKVPENGKATVNVLLDADYTFKLLNIKYSVVKFHSGGEEQPIPVFTSVDPFSPAADGMDQDENFIGVPFSSYLGITLSFQSSGSKVLYGGINSGALGGDRIPLAVGSSQGYAYGFQAIRTPYTLPRQAIMVFELTNSLPVSQTSLPNNLYVAAAIYGMKIRL